ncbi:793_t:CDS:2 [Funneliformis caledonium]|uniref:793_t:CDS:1 n=1 Tax=Funneliformis caledonium TaxID=1117310 RepID=A0A9N9B7Z8_9GLOM|nr:793_t:CDS:2 [Funneliformis caledonium]
MSGIAKNIWSFIFSFENNEDAQNMKLSRVNSQHSDHAIYDYDYHNNYDYGFNFGGHTLYTRNKTLYVANKEGYYEDNIKDDNNYTIEEFEAFRIFKQF